MDVDIHRARLAGVVVAPDPLEKLVASEYVAGVPDQEEQQLEGLGLYGQDLAASQQPAPGRVNSNLPEIYSLLFGRPRLRLGSAQQGPYPRQQLAEAERLGDVVVRPELEPDDLVHLRALGGQHQDRHARFGANDPAHLGATQLGQHEVQQDEVRPVAPERLDGLPPVGRLDHDESFRLQTLGQGFAQRSFVVYDQDRSSHPRVPSYGVVA